MSTAQIYSHITFRPFSFLIVLLSAVVIVQLIVEVQVLDKLVAGHLGSMNI